MKEKGVECLLPRRSCARGKSGLLDTGTQGARRLRGKLLVAIPTKAEPSGRGGNWSNRGRTSQEEDEGQGLTCAVAGRKGRLRRDAAFDRYKNVLGKSGVGAVPTGGKKGPGDVEVREETRQDWSCSESEI